MSRKKRYLLLSVLVFAFLSFASLFLGLWPGATPEDGFDYAVVVHSEGGEELAQYYREKRFYIPPKDVPERVKKAFVAAEDRRFYSHHGFDLRGMIRAAKKNIEAKSVIEGGSTITQQLAKMLLRSQERSFTRKLRELVVAFRLEKDYTKDEILAFYLNLAYFGERIYGIESAARTYFNKHVNELSSAEAAMLAGLQKAPSKYSPLKNPARARERMIIVLKDMKALNYISEEEYIRALSMPLPRELYTARKYGAPHFADFVKQRLLSSYGEDVYRKGFRVYSTINENMQTAAEQAIKDGIRTIERRTRKGVEAALVALDLETGEIRAMVGGTDYKGSQFNRATMALRQPGSAFKPFVYAAAIREGMNCEDLILDGPISIRDPDKGGWWTPRNSWGEYYGMVSLRTAIALSLNSATVRLAQKIGFDDVRDVARMCGISTYLSAHPSISLGSYEVTLLDLTSSYIPFARGYKVRPMPYVRIRDKNGDDVEIFYPISAGVFPPEIVDKMRTLLRAPVVSGIAGLARAVNRPVYGKTGTTNDYSDAWFVGFDDRIAVGVWVGRDDHTPIGSEETGARAALPIWTQFMKSQNNN